MGDQHRSSNPDSSLFTQGATKRKRLFSLFIGLLFLLLPIILFDISQSISKNQNLVAYSVAAHGGFAKRSQDSFLPILFRQNDKNNTPTTATWNLPIALSPSEEYLWVVNPDSNSITQLETQNPSSTVEILAGKEPWSIATSPDGSKLYIIARADGTLLVLDTNTLTVQHILSLGAEPIGIALNKAGTTAYVTLSSANEVLAVDLQSLTIAARIPVAPYPYAVAVVSNNERNKEQVYITHFISLLHPEGQSGTDNGKDGWITVIDAASHTVTNQIKLAPNEHGFPNLLAGIAVLDNRAWIPQVRAAPALPNSLTTTLFAAISALDLSQEQEDGAAYLPLNDQDIFGSPVNNPVAVVPSPTGDRLYTVLAGSNLIEAIDISEPTQPQLIGFVPVGINPRGLTVTQDGQLGYVMNYLSRSVTIVDLAKLAVIAEIPVTTETLPPSELRGKILFHNASNPRLSQGSWISCASCHPDGGTDGVTWFFPDGPRQSPPLWQTTETLPWHWSAALDEPQDVEDTIEGIQHGLGLAPGADPPLLGQPNAGRSEDLDALATFLRQGIRTPNVATAEPVAAGRALFASAGCTACHGGSLWTTSSLPGAAGTLDPDNNGMVDAVLHDVGTYNPDDIRGRTGFDSPSLLNVGITAPYLHDGSMPTLESLLSSGHPDPMGTGNGLTNEEIVLLTAFLKSIGSETEPFQTR